MNGAGKHDLGVMGAIVLEFSYSDNCGNTVSSRQLCYVCEKVTKVYMSRQGCTEMGMLEKDFPMPKNTDHHTTAVPVQPDHRHHHLSPQHYLPAFQKLIPRLRKN